MGLAVPPAAGRSSRPDVADPLRGHTREPDPDQLGGFHVRWYSHRQGRMVGPFTAMAEVEIYMARLGLPRPDELLAPVEA